MEMQTQNVTSASQTQSTSRPETTDPRFTNMESVHERAISKVPTHLDTSSRLDNRVDPAITQKALNVMDEIAEITGRKSVSSRLLDIQEKIGILAERYIFAKKEEQYKKKQGIYENVEKQASIQRTQGWAQFTGGFGTIFLSVAGAALGGHRVGEVLTGLSKITPNAAQTLVAFQDANRTPLSHEQQLYLSTAQSDRQLLESLKRLPETLRQSVLELVRLELRAYDSIAQR